MKYYKIMTDDTFLGIATSNDFLTYYEQNNLLLCSNEEVGQFVEYNKQLYRDTWMRELPNRQYNYIQALVFEISEEEYMILKESINNNEEIIITEPETIINQEIPSTPNISLEFVKGSKINEMSAACRSTIENGFDLELQNGTHHFSLTTQDQLNLMSLNILAQTQSLIPYHADGEECTFYTREEINAIITAANELKIYNTTYYNALKEYINSLETIEEISAITYGTPIPEEYKSDVLKVLE